MCNSICVCIGWGGRGDEEACVGLGVSTLTLTCLGLLELMSLSSEQVASPLDFLTILEFSYSKKKQ